MTTDVRERHGVSASASGGWATAREGESHVTVAVHDGNQVHDVRSVGLTPAEARYLAGRLYRLARRIEERVNAI